MAAIPHPGPRLRRARGDKMVAGVCAGLARYFDTDPVLVRVIFVVLALAEGIGILLYLGLWLVVPLEEAPAGVVESSEAAPPGAPAPSPGGPGLAPPPSHLPHRPRRGVWLGALLILVGVYLLLLNLGLVWWWDWRYGGPAVLIALGLLLLFRRYL